MYQSRLIKTVISGSVSTKDVSDISGRIKYVFPDVGIKSLFNMVMEYMDKFGELPKFDYFKSLFDIEKDSPAKKAFIDNVDNEEVDLIEGSFKSFIEIQVKFSLKKKILDSLKVFENKIKISKSNDLYDVIGNFHRNVSIIVRDSSSEIRKEILMYGEDSFKSFVDEYEDKINNVDGVYKFNFGIPKIDGPIGGFKKDDTITAVAFTSQGKSTFARFVAYHQILSGFNVVFQTAEMSIDTVKYMFAVMHANNHDIWGWESPRFSYKSVIRGKLCDSDKKFLYKASKDLYENPKYGSLYIIQPRLSTYTIDNAFNDIISINTSIMPVDLWVCDYLSMIRPKMSGEIKREDINRMIAETRQFVLFNEIPFLTVHQSNRNGYDEARKDKNHEFSMLAVSDYNEIERSSTVLLTLYQDRELRDSRTVQIQNLKNREGDLFDTFRCVMDGSNGWFYDDDISDIDEKKTIDIINSIDI